MMTNKKFNITSDQWVHASWSLSRACEGSAKQLTLEELIFIIRNRYGNHIIELTGYGQLNITPDSIQEYWDLLTFLYYLNNKDPFIVDQEVIYKIVPRD